MYVLSEIMNPGKVFIGQIGNQTWIINSFAHVWADKIKIIVISWH